MREIIVVSPKNFQKNFHDVRAFLYSFRDNSDIIIYTANDGLMTTQFRIEREEADWQQ